MRMQAEVLYAEVRIGDSVIMVGDSGDGATATCHVHIYVQDVDASFKRAVAAGGTVVQVPIQKGDADKRGDFEDPTGAATWQIGTQVG